ncbi:MAG: Fe-S cluster assembly protein SufD [Nitrincola sp.]|nr:Fe-S cluster assembly protein SufD [Nitrincola sp.]
MAGEFQQQALALAAQQTVTPWLSDLRAQGSLSWQAHAWPTRKTEAWRYTSLLPVENEQWQLCDIAASNTLSDETLAEFIELDAYRLVFVNGRLNSELSSALPAEMVTFADANAAQQVLIKQHLGQIADQQTHLFAALNSSWLHEGVLLHVAANQRLDKPVYVVHVNDQGDAKAVNARVLVVLETGAEATLLEHYFSTSTVDRGWTNALTECVVGANASLKHYRINLESEQALHTGGVHVRLNQDARFNGFTLANGSRLKRIDYHLKHLGSGSDVQLNGIYLPRKQQRVDYHTCVEHCVPHCTTNETFRGVIADSAKAVFNGRIHIHQDAQKTLAEMSNRNLLTSDQAQVNTKPELEIYADDVRCAHGATVSQLNDEALFYLTSRGVSEAEARVMLSFGFVNELVEGVELDVLRHWLRPRIAHMFGQNDQLTRHIIHE